MGNRFKITVAIFILTLLGSCATLKPYERVYVDDASMQIGAMSGEAFEYYVQSIREGGASAGRGKSGGGCGCN
ncbi:MAG: DUF4266 domain-containing protein [Cyclobacteriaceae bacterium]|nr:DUF4266 domain-containing protein [Cyclobacteriaceae bacterium]